MVQLTKNIYAVEVPDDATEIVIHNDPPKMVFSSKIQDPAQCGGDMISLRPGTWRFLFTTKAATEEDARKVVERRKDLKDNPYMGYEPGKLTVCWNALQSLASLLRSKNCDPNKNYALIEKQSSDE